MPRTPRTWCRTCGCAGRVWTRHGCVDRVGVSRDHHDQVRAQRRDLRQGPPRGQRRGLGHRGPVRVRRSGTGGRTRGGAGVGGPAPARAAASGRTRRHVRAARGVRVPVPGDRRPPRAQRGQRAAAGGPSAPARRRPAARPGHTGGAGAVAGGVPRRGAERRPGAPHRVPAEGAPMMSPAVPWSPVADVTGGGDLVDCSYYAHWCMMMQTRFDHGFCPFDRCGGGSNYLY